MVSHGNRLTLRETDEAGNDIATYVYSEQNTGSTQQSARLAGRVDAIESSQPPSRPGKSLVSLVSDVFLPSGYPQSVTDDYLPYQVFDSLQAFCSSIAGLLSSRAVLQGVGVGNANASPTSALLLHILQDSSGRLATIFFAHRVGTALEPECKMYRLAADVFNDIAMILDCLSPMAPAGTTRVMILSAAGILRALCGVAGGSSKASLSAHFARWGNLAELNAKDSSQETVISLLGMLVGSVVVSHITGFKTTWTALLILLGCHLGLNYAAVRSVQMTSLNRQRANIVFSAILGTDPDLDPDRLRSDDAMQEQKTGAVTPSAPFQWTLLTPAQASTREQIFPRDGALTWTWPSGAEHVGTAEMGVSVPTFLARADKSHTGQMPLGTLASVFRDEHYMLALTPIPHSVSRERTRKWHASIILKEGCPAQAQLKAWMHALLAVRMLFTAPGMKTQTPISRPGSGSGNAEEPAVHAVTRSLAFLNTGARFERYVEACAGAGWDVGIAALETRGGRRVVLE